ncbi:MAG: hypothetical protein IJS61_01790 [Firmicutes bacterium]|nr:hypothetical protein [Bacillota bacterium]
MLLFVGLLVGSWVFMVLFTLCLFIVGYFLNLKIQDLKLFVLRYSRRGDELVKLNMSFNPYPQIIMGNRGQTLKEELKYWKISLTAYIILLAPVFIFVFPKLLKMEEVGNFWMGFFIFPIILVGVSIYTVFNTARNGVLFRKLKTYVAYLEGGAKFEDLEYDEKELMLDENKKHGEDNASFPRQLLLTMMYNKAFLQNDREKMKFAVDRLTENKPIVFRDAFLPGYLPLLIQYCIVDPQPQLASTLYKEAEKALINDNDINTKRTIAIYKCFTEKNYQEAKSYLENVKNLFLDTRQTKRFTQAELDFEKTMVAIVEKEIKEAGYYDF